MVRYAKQRDASSCGPVTILNIYKWMGYNIAYHRSISTLRRICNWTDGRSKEGGTYDLDFQKGLKLLGIRKKRNTKPTLKAIDKHIDKGGAIVISYFHPFAIPGWAKKNSGHFTLCVERTNKEYILINDSKKTIINRSRKILKDMISHKVNGNKCCIWLITKN